MFLKDFFMSNNKNTAKTHRYREKRQTKRFVIDFYMDDERQAKIHEWLKSQPNSKEVVLQSLAQTMEAENERI
ncbi:Uncharacterised protein [Moraxella atlantae]|uniref:Uncharacterized protein n=3 Tax=Faucicola atlantae TaxID=34059 RepID=A0A378Q536_9GAMM|nr:Uncharacterised protein [Moraxella atlantae]